MRRTIVGLTVLLMSSLGASSAWCQAEEASFGTAHQLVISADRLFGYVHSWKTPLGGSQDQGSTTLDDKETDIGVQFGIAVSL
jgi:hypothetical protein